MTMIFFLFMPLLAGIRLLNLNFHFFVLRFDRKIKQYGWPYVGNWDHLPLPTYVYQQIYFIIHIGLECVKCGEFNLI